MSRFRRLSSPSPLILRTKNVSTLCSQYVGFSFWLKAQPLVDAAALTRPAVTQLQLAVEVVVGVARRRDAVKQLLAPPAVRES
jgi:hypothetical protein